MQQKPPLIGRKVRFEGKYRGLEGIVLEVEPEVHMLRVWLEVTRHDGMPEPTDGMRAVRHVIISADDDQMFVAPGPSGDVTEMRRVVREYFAAVREWNRTKRLTHPFDPNPAREAARITLDAAFSALQLVIGEPKVER